MLAARRVGWWWSPGLEWPVASPVTTIAAAGARASSGSGLRRAKGRTEAPARLYVLLRSVWTHWRDQMVVGATPATSSGGGGSRSR